MIVPAPNPNVDDEGERQRIISPFAKTTSTVQPSAGKNPPSWGLWIVSSLLVILLIGIGAYFIFQYVNDPYRTLPDFSMDKYLSDYRSMAGIKFKAHLKVANDIGFDKDTGRLMVFTIDNDGGQNHSLVVLIPPKLKDIFFTKGQNYQVSLEVEDGGLIYADSCEKE